MTASNNNGWNQSLSPNIVSGLVLIGDAMAVLASSFSIYFLYVGFSLESFRFYLPATLVNLAVTLIIFRLANLYDFDVILSAGRQLLKVTIICTVSFLFLVTMAFATKISDHFSRVWGFSSFIIELTIICSLRGALFSSLTKWARKGALTRRIAIVGAGELSEKLLNRILTEHAPWNQIIGIFKDNLTPLKQLPIDIEEHLIHSPLAEEDLISYTRRNRVDDVIICLPWHENNKINKIVESLREIPVHLKLAPDLITYDFPDANVASYSGIPVLNLADKPIGGWDVILKLVEDKVLASLLLLFLSPVFLIIALAIRLESPGPIIFKQNRYGFNNQIFKVFKFRTMRHRETEEKIVRQATKDDDRITKVGRFLRRTSLDELPQLVNVLLGSMSLVGPRPHAVSHNEQYAKLIGGYFARHKVKPGITGWAQVNGLRGETDTVDKMERRVRYDIYYIENWSLLLDFKILIWTVGVVFFQDEAY